MLRKIYNEKQMWLHPHQRNQMTENAATGFQTRSHQPIMEMQRGHGIVLATRGRPGPHRRCGLACTEPEVYSVAFAASGSSRALTGSSHAHDDQTNQHSVPNPSRPPQRKAESGQNHPYKREKAPKGLLVTRAPWGPHSARGRDALENGRERRGRFMCPEGLGRLVAPG